MKNKTINKIASTLLTVLLVLNAFSFNIYAAEAETSGYEATVTTSDGSSTNYDTLAEAVAEAMKNEESIVTLNESITLSGQLIMQSFSTPNSLTIELNGFSVSAGSTVFHVGGKTTLTVKDSKGTGSVNGLINLNNTAQVYLVGAKVIGVSTGISLKSADAMLTADKNSSITVTNSFGKAIDLEGNIKIDGILKGGSREILYKNGTIDLSTNADPDGIRIAPSSANYPLKIADVKLPDGYYCFDVNGKLLESTASSADLVTVGNLKPADYTAVDQAIAQANALNRNDYRDFSAVDNAISAVDRTKYVSQQDEVDAMAQAILDAVSALEYKPADYSAVDEAIATANALNKENYSDFSAVENAINAVDRSKNITEQDEVDAMAEAILDAVSALEYKPADYSAVNEAIATANALNKDNYSDFSAVENAINAVDRSKNITEQDEVDAMAEAILDAVSALEYKPADYSAVDEAIAKADALNKDDYSDFSAVENAINAVDRSKNITEQDEVDAMAEAIFNAIDTVIAAENQKSVEAIGAELEKFDENRVTIFWEDEIEALKAKIDELLADENMGEKEKSKLNEYKAQSDKLIEIINNPVEYLSLRLFYFIWDCITWKSNSIVNLFKFIFT